MTKHHPKLFRVEALEHDLFVQTFAVDGPFAGAVDHRQGRAPPRQNLGVARHDGRHAVAGETDGAGSVAVRRRVGAALLRTDAGLAAAPQGFFPQGAQERLRDREGSLAELADGVAVLLDPHQPHRLSARPNLNPLAQLQLGRRIESDQQRAKPIMSCCCTGHAATVAGPTRSAITRVRAGYYFESVSHECMERGPSERVKAWK